MTVVIDGSIAVKWVVDEPRSDEAVALRSESLIAPAIWLAEAANALWRHVRVGELTPAQALSLMSELEGAPVASLAIEPHINMALELATRGSHPVYDCIYLALAIQRGIQLITDDRRFAAAASRLGLADRVRLLGS